jgi:hypothetical protein
MVELDDVGVVQEHLNFDLSEQLIFNVLGHNASRDDLDGKNSKIGHIPE